MNRAVTFLVAMLFLCPLAAADDRAVRDPVLDALLQEKTEDEAATGDQPVVVSPERTEKAPEDEVPDTDEADPKLETLLDEMNAARKKIERVRADVVRRRSAPLISERADKHVGELRFKSPRLLHLELRGPKHLKEEDQRTVRTIVADRYAYMWRVEDNEAERFELPEIDDAKVAEQNPFQYGLAADLRNLKRDYYLTLLGEEDLDGRKSHKVRARPRPRMSDPRYNELVFWIDDELLVPIQFRQVQSDGEIVDTYRLSNVRLNPWWLRNPFKPPPSSVSLVRHDLAKERQ